MPVAFSDSVKRPHLKLEYTQHMIREIEKCSKDFFYFCKYVQVKHPDYGRMKYVPRWYQKEFLNKIINNRFFVGLLSRQIGKTVSVSIYILWYCTFNSEKVVGIVSNKEKSAVKILSEIKKMYEFLPVWLKRGVNEYAKTSIEFDNNTKIMASATTADPFRGETLNCLVADELAFVRKSIQEDFWSSNFPAISASKSSKVIIISTPNGLFDLFERIYSGAKRNENGFVYSKYDWRVIEGRDEEWKQEQIKIITEQKFKQEHAIEFLGSVNTVIETNVLESLMNIRIDPIHYELNDTLRIYENPIEDVKYIMGNDVGKGTGEHYSTIQVFKVLTIKPFKVEQVAAFQDNKIDVYSFADVIHRIANYYNKAFLMIENNAEGSAIVNKIWWDYEYENLVNESSKRTGLGIRATRKTKPKAVLIMKKLIENGDLIIKDRPTIKELSTFMEVKNNIFKGKDGMTDDLISALYWMSYIVEFDLFDEDIEINTSTNDDGWGVLTDMDIENEWNLMD